MLGDCFFAETACRLVGDDNDGDQDGQVRCSKIKVRSIYRTNCTVQYCTRSTILPTVVEHSGGTGVLLTPESVVNFFGRRLDLPYFSSFPFCKENLGPTTS